MGRIKLIREQFDGLDGSNADLCFDQKREVSLSFLVEAGQVYLTINLLL